MTETSSPTGGPAERGNGTPVEAPGADRHLGGKRRDPRALGRLLSVFHAPGRTFAELARSPTIAAALIATALAGAFAATAVSRATDLDALARHAFEQQMESMPGTFTRNMSESDQQQMFETSQKALGLTRNFAPVLGGLGAAIAPLVTAAFFLLAFGILGDKGSYRSILSVVLHASWPATAVGAFLTGLVAWLSYPVPPDRAEALIRTNVASMFDPELHAGLAALASRLDVLLAWGVVLSAIGFSIVLGISRRRSIAVVLALWAFGTLILVGLGLLTDFLNVRFTAGPA